MNQNQFDHDMDSLQSPFDKRPYEEELDFPDNPLRKLFDNGPKPQYEPSYLDRKDDGLKLPPTFKQEIQRGWRREDR